MRLSAPSHTCAPDQLVLRPSCHSGVGEVKFLKHRESGKIRVLMRQEKSNRIIMNHVCTAGTQLIPNAGSDRAWLYNAQDYSENAETGQLESTMEQFAVVSHPHWVLNLTFPFLLVHHRRNPGVSYASNGLAALCKL